MCGICGIFHHQRALAESIVTAMTAAQTHRGPDAEGLWSGEGIVLGHRRLAILDLDARRSSAHAGCQRRVEHCFQQ